MDPVLLVAAAITIGLVVLALWRSFRPAHDPRLDAMMQRLEHMQNESRETARAAVLLAERTIHLAQAYRDLEVVKTHTDHLPDRMAAVQERLGTLPRIDRRLEELHGVFRTTTGRGAIGEDAVRAVLARLPDDAWHEKPQLPTGIPDFGFRTPNGLLVPVDSKTGGADDVQRYLRALDAHAAADSDDAKQQAERLLQDTRRALDDRVRRAARDLAKYIAPAARTTPFVVQALPDAVFDVVSAPVRQEAADHGVILVPYGLLHAFVSTVRRIETHGELDVARLAAVLVKVRDAALRIEETVKNSVERAATMATNAAQSIRRELDAVHTALLSAELETTRGEPKPAITATA